MRVKRKKLTPPNRRKNLRRLKQKKVMVTLNLPPQTKVAIQVMKKKKRMKSKPMRKEKMRKEKRRKEKMMSRLIRMPKMLMDKPKVKK